MLLVCVHVHSLDTVHLPAVHTQFPLVNTEQTFKMNVSRMNDSDEGQTTANVRARDSNDDVDTETVIRLLNS